MRIIQDRDEFMNDVKQFADGYRSRNKEVDALRAQVAALEERLAEADKDAARYKLIKGRLFSLDLNYGDPPVVVITVLWWPDIPVGAGNALDKAIDAAMKDKP